MKLLSSITDIAKIKASSIVKFCTESGCQNDSGLKNLDRNLDGLITKIYSDGEFEGKLNQTVVLHGLSGLLSDRLILAGLGKKDTLDYDCYRQTSGTLSRIPAVRNSESIAFLVETGDVEKISSVVIEGFMLGRFKMTEYKSDNNRNREKTKTISFIGTDRSQIAGIKNGITNGQVVSDSVILARRLAARPGNLLTPKMFASQAQSLSKKYRIGCRILDEKQIRMEKMGAFLGVAKGSAEPPRFVILKYNGSKSKRKPIVLVGKGITFDSGGISLKVPLDMGEMKGDMQGGAIVLAAMIAAARLKLPLNIVGLIPLTENLPSSKALKPGDVVKSRKGKTIEVINTDAEGRLILADALDYANKFEPRAVIDIATLTGGALYVLGYTGAPVLGNDKRLMDAVRASSKASAEKVWEMPIWDEFRKLLESPIADLKNSAGKTAATMTAAAFLENFIGDWPWVHIDIAYTDVEKDGQPYTPKGTTGFGLRLIIHLLSNWKNTQV